MPSPATPAPRPPRTEQERTTRTQQTFLDHAERLFALQGIAATSVTDVVEAADRSIGSLYHHFTNKEGLVAAVVGRMLDRLERSVDDAIDADRWDGASIRDIVSTYVRASLQTATGRPGYKRVLVEASFADPGVHERYRDVRRRLDEGLLVLVLDRADEISRRPAETRARYVIDQLTSTLAARLEASTPTLLDSSDDETFEREAVDAAARYLGLPD